MDNTSPKSIGNKWESLLARPLYIRSSIARLVYRTAKHLSSHARKRRSHNSLKVHPTSLPRPKKPVEVKLKHKITIKHIQMRKSKVLKIRKLSLFTMLSFMDKRLPKINWQKFGRPNYIWTRPCFDIYSIWNSITRHAPSSGARLEYKVVKHLEKSREKCGGTFSCMVKLECKVTEHTDIHREAWSSKPKEPCSNTMIKFRGQDHT